MPDTKPLVDHYEDVRENYTEALNKSSVFEKRELPKYLEKLRTVKITVLDPKELIRVVFYLDDMMEHNELQEGTDIVDWLPENMARNPQFFNRYFKQSKILGMKKAEIQPEQPKQEARNIIPDLNNSTEESVKKLWEQPEQDLIVVSEHSVVENDIDIDVQETKQETEEGSKYLIESTLTDLVTEIQEKRKQETSAQLQKIVQMVMDASFYDKRSLMAQLAEITAYRQLIAGIYSELNIKSPITSVTAQGVKETNLVFNADHNYSMEEFKRGFAHAAVEIKRLAGLEKANIDLDAKLKASERSKLGLLAETTLLNSKLAEAEKAKQASQAIVVKATEQKVLYCYICWEEIEEDEKPKTYYLGTQDKSQMSETGFYLTKYLIKTDRSNGLRFRTKKHAQDQLNRIIKNYKHLPAKSKISLKGHLKQAKLLLLVEQEEFLTPPLEKEPSKAAG